MSETLSSDSAVLRGFTCCFTINLFFFCGSDFASCVSLWAGVWACFWNAI